MGLALVTYEGGHWMQLEIEDVPSEDRLAAGWLLDAAPPGSGAGVASFVPSGFDAYARILHPARADGRYATWADVAAWSGRQLRADSDSKELMVRADGTEWESVQGHRRPAEGTSGLDPARLGRLAAMLAGTTATPERIWALFDIIEYALPEEDAGYRLSRGWRRRWPFTRGAGGHKLQRLQMLEERCGVELAGHRFILHQAWLADGEFEAGPLPSYWWPEDRAWLVHTNVDCPTTYVAGPTHLLNELLADELLETVEARLDHPFDGHQV